MNKLFFLAFLATSCQHVPFLNNVEDPFLAFNGHQEITRWVNYRSHLRMASPKDIEHEHSLVAKSLKESRSIEDKIRLSLILLTTHYPGSNIEAGRAILANAIQEPGLSKDTKIILNLLTDFSKDIQLLSGRLRRTKEDLTHANQEKLGLQDKIQALTVLEQSLIEKSKESKQPNEIKR